MKSMIRSTSSVVTVCLMLAVSLIFSLIVPMTSANADPREVSIKVAGDTVLGDLLLAEGKLIGDGVVMLVHGTLAHKDMELIETLQTALAERGRSSLAITLSLGIDRRRGMYDCAVPIVHRYDDTNAEIAGWIDWLSQQGAGPVTLLGHSRGGGQVALYLASGNVDPLVRNAVLLAPATQTAERIASGYEARYGAPVDTIVQKARAASDKSALLDVPGFLYCSATKASADAILSYYGGEINQDTPSIIASLTAHPVLVVAAGDDQVVPDLPVRMEALKSNKAVRFETVDEAGHMFLDFYAEDVADLIDGFADKQ